MDLHHRLIEERRFSIPFFNIAGEFIPATHVTILLWGKLGQKTDLAAYRAVVQNDVSDNYLHYVATSGQKLLQSEALVDFPHYEALIKQYWRR